MSFSDDLKEKRGRLGCPLFFRLVNILRIPLFFIYPLVPPLRGRLAFEGKNLKDDACRSFAGEGRVADCAFEVSSEGELEQVRPLIDRLLARGGSVEILFASPSVEWTCRRLWEGERDRVRILRMPLLSFFPWGIWGGQSIGRWLTSPILILCRYDFYPELFAYGTGRGRRFYLVSASLKGKSFRWRPLYRRFDKIVCSGERERVRFLDWGWSPEKLASCEFRSVRILSRLASLERVLAPWKDFISWIKGFPARDRLILGNAWPEEMEIFQGTPLQKNVEKGKFLVLIVPHRTGTAFVDALERQVKGLSSYVLSGPDEWGDVLARWKRSPGPIFLNVSGILLELYTLFCHALVGGGHGKGVHSLLEPFWAGCSIYCGPGVSRSGEYDFLREKCPDRVHIVENWRHWSGSEDAEGKIEGKEYLERFKETARWLLEEGQC